MNLLGKAFVTAVLIVVIWSMVSWSCANSTRAVNRETRGIQGGIR